MENKTSKYFKYAIGEIILVVIGILIALQINNWNENLKNRGKEKEALLGIKTALEANLDLYKDVFQPRFDRKKEGLDFLKNASFHKQRVPNDTLIKYMRRMGTDIIFRNDTGPYDALKSSGFDLIQNKLLRNEIVHTYEVLLPAFTRFINDYVENFDKKIEKHKEILYATKIYESDKKELEATLTIKTKDFLNNPNFLELVRIEQNKYNNYIMRMDYVKRKMKELIVKINKELTI